MVAGGGGWWAVLPDSLPLRRIIRYFLILKDRESRETGETGLRLALALAQ